MAKHKKTKEQKKIADLRRRLQFQTEKNTINNEARKSLYSIETTNQPKRESIYSFKHEIKNKASIINYDYVMEDLKRTGILTGSVIAAQLVLFYLLKTHILSLPMVKF